MDWRRPTVEYSLAVAILQREIAEVQAFSGAVCATKQTRPAITRAMRYRCETTSVEGLVQLLACNYLPHGYWFYVTGAIPMHKDVRQVDAKLIAKYGIDVLRTARARRKRSGRANMQYLRHDRFFVLLATRGTHLFFAEESACVRDARETPLQFAGYAVSYRRGNRKRDGTADNRWHSHVQIERGRYNELKAYFLEIAARRSADRLAREFYYLPFEPYAPVRRQLLSILRAVNRARRQAGFEPLPYDVLPLRRRVVKPFEPLPWRVAGLNSAEGRPAVGPE